MEGDEGRKGKEALSGGHLCHVCGYPYPNANPSAKLRRSHRKNCGKAPAAGEREEEEADAAVERNAGEGLLPVRGGGGGGESEGNAGSPSLGSARGDADLVEVKEIAEHASPNVTGVQVITGYCSEAGVINCTSHSDEITKEVGRPAEREDSLDEYQDASPFLHQPDSEVGAAVAHKSDFSIEEIKNLDSVSLGASVAANEISVEMDGVWKDQSSGQPNMTDLSSNEISVEMDGVWKDQSSGQPNMTDLSGESIVGKEVECYSDNRTPGLAEPTVMLESSDGSSVNVRSDNTDIDSKADKTSDYSEFIGDVNGSTSLISDLTCQSTSPRMVESLMEDSMDALHIISEISPSLEEKAGSANAESETGNSRIDFVQTEDRLKLTNAVNTLTNCSSQNKCVEDTLDVQLPVENPFLGNSVCSLDGHQSDHVVTNMDSMWGSDDEGICSEGIKAKGSELGFSCEENPQHVEQLVDKADENPSVEKPNGLSEEVVCSKEIGPEVPTIGQVSASQEHVALLMGQVSTKNPFILDDTRSDDLFELPTENYHSEAQNVAESKLQVDFTPLPLDQLIISNQTSIAEGQHVISDDRVPAISSTCGNGPAVGTEDVSVSSTSDPTKNISLHDASVNNSTQEDGERTNGINFVPSEVFLPAEFSTMPTSQDINALKKDGNDKAPLEDISTKDMTASLSEDNVEEKKETEGTSVKEMNSILKADNVEEEKLTDDTSAKRNAIQHIDDAEKQAGDTVSRETSALQNIEEREKAEDTGAKGVLAVGSMENADAENQTEDTGGKPECKSDNADNKKQSYDTSTEELNDKNQTPDTCSKETNTVQNTSNVEEKKQTEDLADQEGNKQKEGISPTLTVTKQSSERVHVPLKVLLAEASVETKEKKTTAKERVLSFRRRVSKDDSSSAKSGSPKSGADDNKFWSSPARLPENNAEKKSKARKQPWMPFICCHSVH